MLYIIVVVILVIFHLAMLIPLYAWREARSLRVKTLALNFPNLPSEFDGYRIVFVSDFHVWRNFQQVHRKVLAELGRLDGDILLLGGDFQSRRRHRPDGGFRIIDVLAQLASRFPDGALAIRGNHDGCQVREHLKQQTAIRYISHGLHILRRNGALMAIAGVYRSPHRNKTRLEEETRRAAARVPAEARFRILLAHWPDYFPAAKGRFDLILAGDSHGGQIRLPLIGPIKRKSKLPPRYIWGLVRENGSSLYTTSGIGTQALPLRLLCPPEIVVITLRAGLTP